MQNWKEPNQLQSQPQIQLQTIFGRKLMLKLKLRSQQCGSCKTKNKAAVINFEFIAAAFILNQLCHSSMTRLIM